MLTPMDMDHIRKAYPEAEALQVEPAPAKRSLIRSIVFGAAVSSPIWVVVYMGLVR